MRERFEHLRAFVRAQPALSIGLCIALAACVAIACTVRRDSFVPLYAAPLASEQAAEVSDVLAAWGVPCVAAADNVRVDAARRSAILLRLSLAGVPHPRVLTRSEALSKASALTPQAVLEAESAEGLAGDIELGLRGAGGIRDARVIIAPARPPSFADETAHDATASVRLNLEPGAVLSRAVADGIRAYVAAAVPGLDPKRVALLDDRAIPLPTVGGPPDAGERQSALQSELDAAFGAGATIVRVHEEYDGASRRVHVTERRPLGGATISSVSIDERYANDKKTYAKHSGSDDRGSNLRDERSDLPPGTIARLSVAIAVDRSRSIDLVKLRSLAAASVGSDPARGDTIAIEEVDFVAPAQTTPNPLAAISGFLASVVPALAAAAVGVAAFRSLGRPLVAAGEAAVTRSHIGQARRAVSGYPPSAVRGALSGEPPHTAAAIISALPAATATAVLELYPPEERAAIVRRMARVHSPVVPDLESVLQRG